jgi:rSAM/selenodomain-associated transferase 2
VTKSPLLTIIIPARNEGATLPTLLRSLARQNRISDCEVLVVDGASTDNTVAVAESFPYARAVKSTRGRAVQMNSGAQAARAKALWFLHADTTLPDHSCVDALLSALAQPGVNSGAFQFHLRGTNLWFQFVNKMVNLRAKAFQRPFGDQGIFVDAAAFREVGGYRELEVCEDVDLVLRLRKTGRFCLLPQTVETSARTWQAHGPAKITFWHLAVLARYQWQRMTGKLPPVAALSPAKIEEPKAVSSKLEAPASSQISVQSTPAEGVSTSASGDVAEQSS